MFNNYSSFQIIALGLAVVIIMGGITVFAVFGGMLGKTNVGNVTVWGTVDEALMNSVITELLASDKSFQNVQYVEKDVKTYQTELVNAMAEGGGPDLFFTTQEQVETFANKVIPIPYSTLSQADYTKAYIDEGTLFLVPEGALALPIFVDPMVMYWNKNAFATAGIPNPPTFWNDLIEMAPKLTVLDAKGNIQKSAIAFGVWSNVVHAKEILTLLFMQAGDNIVVRDTTGAPQPVFGSNAQNASENPTQSALQFYTEFANPTKTTYSWNRALRNSTDAFAAGDLALYFGFASEYGAIQQRNPNLNFAVAEVPQVQGAGTNITFGRLMGVAVSRTAANTYGAFIVAQKLTDKNAVTAFATATGLPPVRRDITIDTSSSLVTSVFVQSARISHAWLDPEPNTTEGIMRTMVESVISGASNPSSAVSEAAQAFTQIYLK